MKILEGQIERIEKVERIWAECFCSATNQKIYKLSLGIHVEIGYLNRNLSSSIM